LIKGSILAVLCFWILSCAQVPITGRESLHLVPNSDLLRLSLQEYEQVLKKSKLSSDEHAVAMVRRVGLQIARAAEDTLREMGREDQIAGYKWEFNLIEDDKTVNAWVMPGGKAAVYTGILPITKDETGLAVVLGHEVGHALADHGNERMSQALLANFGAMALSTALASRPQVTRDIFMQVYGIGAQVGVLLPFSRLQESEADHMGLILMARAGYDPREAVAFWKRMNEKEGGARPPEFLSTHPAPESRIAAIKGFIPEAMDYYK